ncbi:MAG: hypothetical protein OEW67_06115, partial [Cyclobacteriaceae bacterium]|nr:hypothetical protein [Cyclobacteriaceae bacterium]
MMCKKLCVSIAFQLVVLLGWAYQPTDSLLSEIRHCEQQVERNMYYVYDSMEYYALRQMELANQLGDSVEIGRAHLTLGIAYFNLDQYEKEINNLITAKRIFQSIG